MALLCAGIWALVAHQNSVPEEPVAPKGATQALPAAPSLRFASKENAKQKEFLLRSLEGRPILIHFWATWCAPCVAELPELAQQAPELQRRGISLVTVSEDSDWGTVEHFLLRQPQLSALKESAVFLLDPNNQAAGAFNSNQFPETFLIDQKFQIAHKFTGAQSWAHPEMQHFLAQWLK